VFFQSRRIDAVMCSSTVDDPMGVPEGFDAREVLAVALDWSDTEDNKTLRAIAGVVAEGNGTPEQAQLIALAFLRLTEGS